MANRDAFIIVVNTLKALSQTITDEQRKALLQQAVQQHGLSIDEADHILKASGLVVGESINYFEVLGFSIEELQNQSEDVIAINVDIAHKKYYAESLRAGGLPRPDGRTQEQWRTVLNQARDTLKDPQKRTEHLATLQTEISQRVDPIPQEELPTSKPTSSSASGNDEMALIPAGEFEMGSEDQKILIQILKLSHEDPLYKPLNDESPVHAIYTDEFYIDKYPVTNAQYKVFIDTNPQWCKPPKWYEWDKKHIASLSRQYSKGNYLKHWNGNRYPIGKADHPVTHVSWYAAMAYAQWVGKRLPTEAEWEKAARGGIIGQKYPWGNSMDSNMAYCGKNVGETTSVGKYPANNYGLHDIVGNVWEWCLDEYNPIYYSSSPIRNPVAGANTEEDLDLFISNFTNVTTDCVLRGGSLFTSSEPSHTANRLGGSPLHVSLLGSPSPTLAYVNIGFRCAKDVTN